MDADVLDANASRPSEAVPAAPATKSTAQHRDVALRLDPARLRRVHQELARRLGAEPDVRVAVIRGDAQQPVPSLELLFSMERLVHRVVGPRLADRIEWRELSAPERPSKQARI